MHKTVLILPLVLLAFLGLTACNKTYTCDCTFSYQVDGQTVTENATSVDEFRSKSQASESCQDRAEDYLNTGASAAECVSSVK